MNPLGYRRPSLQAIFIATESLAWFSVIAFTVATLDRAFLRTLIERMELALAARQLADGARAETVLLVLRADYENASGVPVVVVMGAAFGGFLLMRLVQRLDLGSTLGALVLVAATILSVNLLIHAAMGSLRPWDPSQIAEMVNHPGAQGAAVLELNDFVARDRIGGPYGSALAIIAAGLTATWFRFMLVARSPVYSERIARSFTVSFIVVLIMMIVARVSGVTGISWVVVPLFLLGMLGLAVANHDRAVPAGDSGERVTPWITAVGGTLILFLGASALIALLVYLQAGMILSAIGDVLIEIVRIIFLILMTPIVWILERIFAWALDGRMLDENFFRLPEALGPLEVPDEFNTGEGGALSAGVRDTLKFLLIVGILYAMFRVAQVLIGRRNRPEEVAEVRRASTSRGAGIGQLMADLLTVRRRRRSDQWVLQHPVYQLFARAVDVSRARGLRIGGSETPEEFGQVAVEYLDAHPIARSARLFEEVRYGRHYPPQSEVQVVVSELRVWDEANPPTEEMRERVRGLRPTDEGAEIAMRVALMKKGMDPTNEALFRGE